MAHGSPEHDYPLRQRTPVSARRRPGSLPPGLEQYLKTGDALLAEPFKGVTADGRVVPGLFGIEPTGVSTSPLRDTARAFLDSLDGARRARATFPVSDDAWRRWSNIHPFLMRHGLSLDEMTGGQRALALELLRASLSAGGYETARDVMRLNEFVRTLTGSEEEYGEWLYWLSVMGAPSESDPGDGSSTAIT